MAESTHRKPEPLARVVTVLRPFRAAGRAYEFSQEVRWVSKGWVAHRLRAMIRRGEVFNGDLAAYIEHLGPEESLKQGLREMTFDEFEAAMQLELERMGEVVEGDEGDEGDEGEGEGEDENEHYHE